MTTISDAQRIARLAQDHATLESLVASQQLVIDALSQFVDKIAAALGDQATALLAIQTDVFVQDETNREVHESLMDLTQSVAKLDEEVWQNRNDEPLHAVAGL